MQTLYLTSIEPQSGKTVLATAFGQLALSQGKRVSYVKPVDDKEHADDEFVSEALGIDKITVNPSEPDALDSLANSLSSNTDLLIIEDSVLDNPRDIESIQNLEPKVILVAWYQNDADIALIAQKAAQYDKSLAGVVINGVAPLQMHQAETTITQQLQELGIVLVGFLPQDRVLDAPTIGEITKHLDGELRYFPEKSNELIENIMIGALALDGGVYYFEQKPNKLVITRWDRPDLQNAALETDTKGFILTGGEGPIPYMEHRVQEHEIPVIVVDEGTIAIADKLNGAFGRGKMHPDKVKQAVSLVEKHLDLSKTVPVLVDSR